MALIHVPRPDIKKAMDPGRPVSSLLKTQIEHLHAAERRLPLRHHTDIYINAIKTEGEAAEYIRAVTQAIHRAHEAAATRRARRKPQFVGDIAAVAEDAAEPKRSRARKKGKPKIDRIT